MPHSVAGRKSILINKPLNLLNCPEKWKFSFHALGFLFSARMFPPSRFFLSVMFFVSFLPAIPWCSKSDWPRSCSKSDKHLPERPSPSNLVNQVSIAYLRFWVHEDALSKLGVLEIPLFFNYQREPLWTINCKTNSFSGGIKSKGKIFHPTAGNNAYSSSTLTIISGHTERNMRL